MQTVQKSAFCFLLEHIFDFDIFYVLSETTVCWLIVRLRESGFDTVRVQQFMFTLDILYKDLAQMCNT